MDYFVTLRIRVPAKNGDEALRIVEGSLAAAPWGPSDVSVEAVESADSIESDDED